MERLEPGAAYEFALSVYRVYTDGTVYKASVDGNKYSMQITISTEYS